MNTPKSPTATTESYPHVTGPDVKFSDALGTALARGVYFEFVVTAIAIKVFLILKMTESGEKVVPDKKDRKKMKKLLSDGPSDAVSGLSGATGNRLGIIN